MFNGARPETRMMYNNSLLNATLRYATPNRTGFLPSNILTSSRTSLYIPEEVFVVDLTNRVFPCNFGAGDLALNIAVGTYTAEELLLELNFKIGYGLTITYDRVLRKFGFKCTSNFTFYCNLNLPSWALLGITLGLPFTGLANVQYYSDTPKPHDDINLFYDLGGSADCGFFALLGERNKTNCLSSSAVVELRLSNIDDISTAIMVPITTTINGTFSFLDGIIPVPVFRYVWITIKDPNNISEYIAFSHLYLGGFVFWNNRTIDHGFTLQYLDRSVRTESVSGALFFEKYNKYAYLSGLKLSYLTRQQVALLQQVWFDLGKSEHFYLSLDSGHMNGDLSEFMFYGVFDEDPTIEEIGPRFFNSSFSFRGD